MRLRCADPVAKLTEALDAYAMDPGISIPDHMGTTKWGLSPLPPTADHMGTVPTAHDQMGNVPTALYCPALKWTTWGRPHGDCPHCPFLVVNLPLT